MIEVFMDATRLRRTCQIGLLGVLLGSRGVSAQGEAAHAHIHHVVDAFEGTPNDRGLLPTAMAEAEIVIQHVGFAAQDPTNLYGIKRHMSHVLHAIDPTLVEGGPGLGYGLRSAAAGVLRHIELAASAYGASDNVKVHAAHAASSGGNAVACVDAILALARQIQTTNSGAEAATLLETLNAQANALLAGIDVDGDGRVGWQPGEGGLRQITQHMALMKRGEGLAG